MLDITGPQLKPLAQLLQKFDRRGFVPDIYNQPGDEGIIVLSYPHRTYNERYFISRSGNIERKDVVETNVISVDFITKERMWND